MGTDEEYNKRKGTLRIGGASKKPRIRHLRSQSMPNNIGNLSKLSASTNWDFLCQRGSSWIPPGKWFVMMTLKRLLQRCQKNKQQMHCIRKILWQESRLEIDVR